VPNASGIVSDIPSTVDTDYFKGKIVMKVDGQIVDEYVRQRVKPTQLPQVNGNQYSLEVYDANTNELCSSSTISFGATPPIVVGGDVDCGELDIDQNEVADVRDLANFARKYNKSCTDDYT